MSAAPRPIPGTAEFSWHVATRWQEFEGEARANLLRIISVVVFYAVELASFHGLQLGALQIPPPAELSTDVHRGVTAVVAGWILLAYAVHFCLKNRMLPSGLKYVSSACDISLLTCILLLGTGPRSPMVAGYFLLIALAAQRFSLPLIRATTVGCMLGYLTVCGNIWWYQRTGLGVQRYHQLLVLAALALVGIATGQMIRRIRTLAEDYVRRMPRTDPGTQGVTPNEN